MIGYLQDILIKFIANHSWGAVLLSVVLFCRAIFKPILSALEAGVAASGSAKAKAMLDGVEGSKFFKMFAWLMDYLLSIKINVVQASMQSKDKPSS